MTLRIIHVMLGLVVTLAFCGVAAIAGSRCLQRIAPQLNQFEALGLGGSFVLGFSGLLIMLFGLASMQLAYFAPILVLLIALWYGKGSVHFQRIAPTIREHWLLSIAFLIILIFVIVAVLAPLDMRDWDSLAYHFAVPKLWILRGKVDFVQAIHHSNFPFTADMLYVLGLKWGGVAGAKAFNLCWMLLGSCALFGIAKRWFGGSSAWIAALGFAVTPVIFWESGTGYIDIPHGLFCGFATLYFAELFVSENRGQWWLFGLSLGFALGTKHTGLQFLLAILVVGAVATAIIKMPSKSHSMKAIGLASLLAFLIAAPWYAKSIAFTGNPVYPFFYKQLGGKYWNQWRADIYANEQKSFGVGSNPIELGNAVFGLAYQPGRFVNPGQTEGQGFPTGAIGFVGLLGGVFWLSSGKARGRELLIISVVGAVLLMWFLLSQQSRYLTAIVVPLMVLASGAASKLKWKNVLATAVAMQAAYSCFMLWMFQTQIQLQVVSGAVSAEDYQKLAVPFYGPAQEINALPAGIKVALYDEVFGFYLGKPYMWANPGHSTLIPYEQTEIGGQFRNEMVKLGFTHAYVNFQVLDKQKRARWFAAMTSEPFSAEEIAEKRENPDLWWRVLVADAVMRGELKVVKFFPSEQAPRSALFEFAR